MCDEGVSASDSVVDDADLGGKSGGDCSVGVSGTGCGGE